MMRFAVVIPIAALVGVPLWTAPSLAVLLVGALAGVFCAVGVLRLWLPCVTLGGSLAVIDYALAASLGAGGLDIVRAVLFGLALLFLLDLAEFARRFRGSEIAPGVHRAQLAFWFGRAGVAVAAIALLSLSALIFADAIQPLRRPMVAGLGAAIAFAGAMRGAIVREGPG